MRIVEEVTTMHVEHYWIMGEKVIPINNSAPVTFAISNPQIFDVDVEELCGNDLWDPRYRGFAYWQISLEAFRSGWILARHQYSIDGDSWLFEFSTLAESIDSIKGFLGRYYRGWRLLPNNPVELRGLDDFDIKFYSRSVGGVSTFLGGYLAIWSEC